MTKTTTLFLVLLIMLTISCKKKNLKDDPIYYRAINGKDTALLSLTFYKTNFYGRFEFIYGKMGKDSGAVRGKIYGDTLKGEYNYISYGGSKSIAPFTLLKKDGKLRLGRGLKSTYMGIPFYVSEVPIDYEIGFIFDELLKPLKK